MQVTVLAKRFAFLVLLKDRAIPVWALGSGLFQVFCNGPNEVSILCDEAVVHADQGSSMLPGGAAQIDWGSKCLRFDEVSSSELVRSLSKIISVIEAAQAPVSVITSFTNVYLLVTANVLTRVKELLALEEISVIDE